MISWVFAAGAAGFAFFLSGIVGIISGVGFVSLILRALVSGLIFALLATGGELLMRSFFPDLLPAPPRKAPTDESADEDSEEAGGAAVDITLDDEDEDSAVLEAGGDIREQEFVEEVGNRQSEAQLAVEESDDEVESLESVDSMEELPSLDGFSDSFESSYGGDQDESSYSGGSKDADVDIMGQTQNVGEVTQAVKTMLKRDQEG